MVLTACDNCGESPLPPRRRKYCSDKCSHAANMRRYRARKKGKDTDASKPEKYVNRETTQRSDRGDCYHAMKSGGWFEELAAENITQTEVAEILGFTQPTISKTFQAWREDKKNEREARGWDKGSDKLGPAPPLPDDARTPAGRKRIDGLVEHFVQFRTLYFIEPVTRKPFKNPDYLRRWARDLIQSLCQGGKKVILSPPRHGKTALLSHICVWLIVCINPNIRIMMIGGNQDIASNLVGVVKDHLEDNQAIKNDWLPPGKEFKPGRNAGKSWTNTEFTVATRNIPGIKSPTMVAIGRSGKILSRDADLILVDDIDDDDSTHTVTSREKTRRWWGITVMSRKEQHTAVFIIGSRQHPDDIYSYLLEDPGYNVTVEQAHDDGACEIEPYRDGASIYECGCDEGVNNIHDTDCHLNQHQDCLLFPEVRSMQWLAEKAKGAESSHTFPMVYQNEPVDDDIVTFPRDLVDSCKDQRSIGVDNLPEVYTQGPKQGEVRRYRLIAGLDPSGTGYQAVFLWAFDPATNELFAVDLENRLGGGIRRAREQIEYYYKEYGVTHWAIETNLYHGELVEDRLLRDFTNTNGIAIHPVRTGSNKHDKAIGVSKLADFMADARLHIPYGDVEAKSKFHQYVKQLVNYSRDAQAKNARSAAVSDLVMASWFPLEILLRWRRQWLTDKQEQVSSKANYPFRETRYPFTPAA